MKKVLVITFFISLSCFANNKTCSIDTYAKVLYLPGKTSAKFNEVIKKSDCPLSVKRAFSKKIFQSNGSLSARILNAGEEVQKSGYKITLSPSRVNVINLKNQLKEKFKLDSSWSFAKLGFLNKRSAIGLEEEDSIDFSCEFCHTTGKKSISLTVYNPIKNFSKTHWLNGNVLISTSVLVPIRPVSPAESQLSPSNFKVKVLQVSRPEQYFTNKNQLVFYKVNKPLSTKKGLLFSDLTPVNLVSVGIPAKVVLRSKGLLLEGTGIPSQSGKFGEVIKLRNPKTKRFITGKVIDFNKVMVDL